jgi:hypothetical protein
MEQITLIYGAEYENSDRKKTGKRRNSDCSSLDFSRTLSGKI